MTNSFDSKWFIPDLHPIKGAVDFHRFTGFQRLFGAELGIDGSIDDLVLIFSLPYRFTNYSVVSTRTGRLS